MFCSFVLSVKIQDQIICHKLKSTIACEDKINAPASVRIGVQMIILQSLRSLKNHSDSPGITRYTVDNCK